LEDLKKDIASKQEVFDSQQVKDLRREIQKLEYELKETQSEKE
jgi:hypothetical protein